MFSIFQRKNNCLRSRLFELVDGTGQDDHRTLFVAIHDIGIGGRKKTRDFKALVKSAFRGNEALLLSLTIQIFEFHREFLASEYRPPPLPHSRNADVVHDDGDTRGRL